MEIKKISIKEALKIIDDRKPVGCFIVPEKDGRCTAIDNSTKDAWTEIFNTEESARRWLKDKSLEPDFEEKMWEVIIDFESWHTQVKAKTQEEAETLAYGEYVELESNGEQPGFWVGDSEEVEEENKDPQYICCEDKRCREYGQPLVNMVLDKDGKFDSLRVCKISINELKLEGYKEAKE